MTQPRESDPEAGLLRMLREALRAGLAAGADDEAFAMARSSAQIIGLRGLDAGLEALAPHRGRPWSGAARELVERVENLAAEPRLHTIRGADPDLAARAKALREWRSPAISEVGEREEPVEAEMPPGAMTVAEALADMALASDPATERSVGAWLTPQVGTALRAALEWLSGDAERSRPFRLRAEDSVLEVTCENASPEGIAAAHEVLAAAEGCLSPLGEIHARSATGAWLVRMPAWSARPVHLMLEQGELRLAVPWHAVLRLSMVPAIEIELRGGTLATPVLPPLAPLLEGVGERPVVAIAHGLKRALLVADRLVWRLGAEPCEPPSSPPAPGLVRTVRSVEGEVFWVADPAVLLGEVAVPSLASAGPVSAKSEKRAPEAPAPAPGATTALDAPEAERESVESPLSLDAEDVEPLALTLDDVEPVEQAVAKAELPPAPPALSNEAATSKTAQGTILPDWLERFGTTGGPAPTGAVAVAEVVHRPGAPAILIAEDSIAARHFLTRLLEQRGFVVHAVETAAALRAALATRSWSFVFADVELPDARGRELLDELRTRLEDPQTPLVALVRDDEDAELAAASGVSRWLRKPFDRDEVDHLLSRLGLREELGS